MVEPSGFRSGREFAAWLGLVHWRVLNPGGLAEHVRMNATEAEPGPSCKISYLLRLRRLRPLRPRKGGQCAVRCSG
jgi:hypothetical protein